MIPPSYRKQSSSDAPGAVRNRSSAGETSPYTRTFFRISAITSGMSVYFNTPR